MPVGVLIALIGLMGTMGMGMMNNQTQRMSLDQTLLLSLMSSKDPMEGMLMYMILKGGFSTNQSWIRESVSSSVIPSTPMNNTTIPAYTGYRNEWFDSLFK